VDLIQDNKWQVRVTFLGPYCVVPHIPKEDAAYRRGSNHVNVHVDKQGCRPYIRGTLIRSSLIKSVEFLIALEKHILEFMEGERIFHDLSCCSGEYERRAGAEAPSFLRRRAHFDFGRKPRCVEPETACPLCLLLGRFDLPENRNVAGRQSVHFGNFDAEGHAVFPSFESFAGNRIGNRIDRSKGIAEDHHDIWEIDESVCGRYIGTVTFGQCAARLPALKYLLAAGLAQIDTLAGSLCRVDVLGAEGGISEHQSLLEAFFNLGRGPGRSRNGDPPASAVVESPPLDPSQSLPAFEWIVRGRLTAETPFLVGTNRDGAKTGPAIAPTLDGRLRIPHSAIRGALRETMQAMAEGGGCNAGFGEPTPCECDVCRTLNRVAIADAKSDPGLPVEVRRRIGLAPASGTLKRGAVFDMEAGPRGLCFSFELRLRSHTEEIDPLLLGALALWKRGMLFVGGSQGTGKGRMSLQITGSRLLKLYAGPDLLKRLLARGFLGNTDRRLFEDLAEREIKFPDVRAPWQKIEYTLAFRSPLIIRDPSSALSREDSHGKNCHAVQVRKTVLDRKPDGTYRSIHLPFLKGESLRGLLKHATGKTAFPTRHDQEECQCDVCALLGNERRRGLLVIEDAEPIDAEGMRLDPRALETGTFDRAAIDRFQGGAVHGWGYDDTPLVAAPHRPLAFKGIIWAHEALLEKRFKRARNLLASTLADLRDGLLPVGGCGAVGYGKVASLRLESNPLGLALRPEPITPSRCGENRLAGHGASCPALDREKVYHPYYFLEPKGTVCRTRELVPHDRFIEDRFTGKLLCTLKTDGPVFVPDVHESAERGRHQEYRFMRICGRPALPGSMIRGVVSSVFEALTNSCFRVLDEDRRLSWRMDASHDGNLEHYHPGRVTVEAGKWKIEKMTEARLPFYDTSKTFKKIAQPTRAAAAIARASTLIHEFLGSLAPQERNEILRGRIPINVELAKADRKNPHDTIVCSLKPGGMEGYLKISGPNVLEMKRHRGPDGSEVPLEEKALDACSFPDIRHEEVLHVRVKSKGRQIPVTRRLGKKEDRIIEYIMKKRCERIFLPTSDKRIYDIPPAVVERYAELVQMMKENPQAPPRVFQTFPLNTDDYTGLQAGDLVYFREDDAGSTAVDIVPVRISRRMAPHRLGEMLARSFRPCTARPAKKEVLRADGPDAACKAETTRQEGLCPACLLFGTPSYKGRVRFGIAFHDGGVKWYMGPKDEAGTSGETLTLPILEAPRPAWAMPAPKTLDRELPEVPGRKFYVHHPSTVDHLRERRLERGPNNCTIELMGGGNRFEFEVDFDNLSAEELGLLIYSIELQEGLGHKLGKGKPLGLGTSTMSVDAILCRDVESGALSKDVSREKRSFMESGFRQLEEWSRNEGKDWKWFEIPRIASLHEMLRMPDGDGMKVFYPTLKQDQDMDGGYPCYETIKETWGNEERRMHLTTPWNPWHPLKNLKTAQAGPMRRLPGGQKGETGSRTSNHTASAGPMESCARMQFGAAPRASTLYVTNLPYSSTTDEVKSFFSMAGNVVWVRLLEDRESGRPKGNGFVEMASAEEAARARELLQNKPFKERPVRIDWAKQRGGWKPEMTT